MGETRRGELVGRHRFDEPCDDLAPLGLGDEQILGVRGRVLQQDEVIAEELAAIFANRLAISGLVVISDQHRTMICSDNWARSSRL